MRNYWLGTLHRFSQSWCATDCREHKPTLLSKFLISEDQWRNNKKENKIKWNICADQNQDHSQLRPFSHIKVASLVEILRDSQGAPLFQKNELSKMNFHSEALLYYQICLKNKILNTIGWLTLQCYQAGLT